MTHDFEGYCPEKTIADASLGNPELAAALLQAHEAGVPGICGALVVSKEIFSGDRQACLTASDCIFRR